MATVAAALACCSLGRLGLPAGRLAAVSAKDGPLPGSPAADQEVARKMQLLVQANIQIFNAHQRRQARKVVAVLALKCVLTCLLMARTRVMRQSFERTANGGKSWEEDQSMPAWAMSVLKVVLGAFGPTPGDAFLPRLQGLLTNSMESEPWFIGVVCMYCLVGATNLQRINFYAHAVQLMWGYVACRLVHAAAFLLAVRQPVRAFSWAGSVLCIVGMAVLCLL